MNVLLVPELNEQGIARRSSSASEESNESSDADNPLMKLVDAALAPSSDFIATSEKVNDCSIKNEIEASGPSPEAAEKSNLELEDANVIRGTVQDLVARQEKKVSFAEYLMQCLNDEANHDVLQWMPCGTQFTITNHRKFTMERMPNLFKIRNMSSFVRKLTRWGFSRVHEKETGNSDIFKHPHFQREKTDLCKKIRCVSRGINGPAKSAVQMGMSPGSESMGNISESSMHRMISGDGMNLHMVSPRRSMGHAPSFLPGRSPHASQYAARYHPHQTPGVSSLGHSPPHRAPRVSPEYEKEMIGNSSAFSSRPGPPQVYSPPTIGRSMSAAAEYELEQVLLERQRARVYREQQQLQAAQQQHYHNRPRGVSPSALSGPMGSSSERSMGSMSERRYSAEPGFLAAATNSVVTAALETLHREGEYDLDMSPREAMLRAVLHKRQQQRAQQRAGGGGILKHSSSYPDTASAPPPPRHPSYYR